MYLVRPNNFGPMSDHYRQVPLSTLGDTNSDDEDDTSGIYANREIVGQDNVKRTKKLREITTHDQLAKQTLTMMKDGRK